MRPRCRYRGARVLFSDQRLALEATPAARRKSPRHDLHGTGGRVDDIEAQESSLAIDERLALEATSAARRKGPRHDLHGTRGRVDDIEAQESSFAISVWH